MGTLESPTNWPAPEGRRVKVGGLGYHVIEVGSGPPALFLHGGGPGTHGWSDFGPVVPYFSRDRRCIVVDLLQYGKSDKPAITEPAWSFHAASLANLLRVLGVDKAEVICNSWGGSAGICLAAHHPELVSSLVVTGSMPVRHGAIAPLPEGLSGTGPGRGKRARDTYYGGSGPSPEKMRDLMAEFEWYDPARIPEATVQARYSQSIDDGEVHLYRAGIPRGEPEDLTPAMRSLAQPVLFMWGLHDYFLTPDYPLMLTNLVRNGSLHVMARAAHHLQEERPFAYYLLVRAFLDAQREERT